MAKRTEVYKCEKCGNIVFVLHGGPGALVCCGEKMILMEPKTADWKNEKHVPAVTKTETGIKVVVGSTIHPMKEEHFIEWIAVTQGDQIYTKFLKPNEAPEAEFPIKGEVVAWEYCNLHGLWKTS